MHKISKIGKNTSKIIEESYKTNTELICELLIIKK